MNCSERDLILKEFGFQETAMCTSEYCLWERENSYYAILAEFRYTDFAIVTEEMRELHSDGMLWLKPKTTEDVRTILNCVFKK